VHFQDFDHRIYETNAKHKLIEESPISSQPQQNSLNDRTNSFGEESAEIIQTSCYFCQKNLFCHDHHVFCNDVRAKQKRIEKKSLAFLWMSEAANYEYIQWSCNVCTLLNPAYQNFCGACCNPKYKPCEPKWTCNVCSLDNMLDQTKCEACDSPKFVPSSTDWVCQLCGVDNLGSQNCCSSCHKPKQKSREDFVKNQSVDSNAKVEMISKENFEVIPDPDAELKCDLCGCTCASEKKLKKHRMKQHGVCGVCTYKCGNFAALRKHTAQFHNQRTDQNTAQVKSCKETAAFQKEIKEVHFCGICSAKCANTLQLMVHRQNLHAEYMQQQTALLSNPFFPLSPSTWSCGNCGLVTSDTQNVCERCFAPKYDATLYTHQTEPDLMNYWTSACQPALPSPQEQFPRQFKPMSRIPLQQQTGLPKPPIYSGMSVAELQSLTHMDHGAPAPAGVHSNTSTVAVQPPSPLINPSPSTCLFPSIIEQDCLAQGTNPERRTKEGKDTSLLEFKSNKIKPVEFQADPCIRTGNFKIETDELNSAETNSLDCCICSETLEQSRRFATVPCGHTSFCESCIKKQSKCPICRTNINQLIKIFLS